MRRSLAVVSCALAVCGAAAGCSSEGSPPKECVDRTADALRTCAKGATLTGVDVSYYQGNVGWAQVKASGRSFAFARVTDGLTVVDTKFSQNWPAMKAAGIVRGAYQFFRPAQDPTEQADLMLAKITAAGGLGPGDLPPVLDLESDGGLAPGTVVARAKTWIARVEATVGAKPIVYTAAFMSSVIGTSFAGYTLWVANYGPSCPLMPSGWTDWAFWQNADDGSVPGIAGPVDTNLFNGTLTQLGALTLQPADAGSGGSADGGAGNPAPQNDPGGAAVVDPSPPARETTAAPLDPCP